LQFEYALWTLAIIREVIRRQFGVRLSEVSVGRLMKRLGFTPQRPLYRAWQQDPILVERWRTEEYPAIAAKTKREGAVIFFADESGVRSDAHAGTTWGLKGATPVVKTTGARFGFNMLSAVSARGQLRFMIVERRVTAAVFCEFLRRLLQGMTRKIVLIVDGHPTHKAKRVQRFVAAQADRLELCVLPPYSPDLNPDELAWAHVKGKLGRGAARTKTELKTRAHGILRSLQKRPHLVSHFFQAPSCAYAAA
jgi:transposase